MKKVILLLILLSAEKLNSSDENSVKLRKLSPTSALAHNLMEQGFMGEKEYREFLNNRAETQAIPLQEKPQYTNLPRERAVSEPKQQCSLMHILCCCCYCCCSNE